MEPIEVTTEGEVVPVGVKIDGEIKPYTLKELLGTERDGYVGRLSKNMKYDSKGNALGLRDFTAMHSKLLAITLFDENDEAVDIKTLQTWPGRTLSTLYKASNELSGLNDEGAEEIKND